VHEDTTAQLADMVLAKEIDLALLSLPIIRRGLESEVLFEEDLLVAFPRNHLLAGKKTGCN
jgi:DNA-binding transcriptional LysR family regulator